jgi:mono/diheme cytochrome c family protein
LWTVAVLIALVAIGAGYFVFGPGPTGFAGGSQVALEQYRDADPTGVPVGLKSASQIERGEYLTRAADCMVCHTADNGVPFAGGRPFVLPFGTLYSTNITPDVDTGIGGYTDADFLNAVHAGMGRGNVPLYPAMPFASYTYMTDADALAIKAYLFTLAPVHAAAPQNVLAFPFNQRSLMRLWAVLLNPDKRYEPRADRSPQWNRGAYLAEALGHCGECHTPRNPLFALDNRRKFAGAVQAGWRAYNITPDRSGGIGLWSDADLEDYLSRGHADGRGTAAGPMGEAVDASLSHLSPGDITAMVAYLRTVPVYAATDLEVPKTEPAPAATTDDTTAGADPRGKAIYEGACAGCHGWTGISPVLPFATLTGTRGVNDPTAVNVAQVIIGGAARHTADGGPGMPSFGGAYSDAEIAGVANYVTRRFGARGSSLTPAQVAKLRSED